MAARFRIHQQPAWASRADFVINGVIQTQGEDPDFEQLRVRQTDSNHFEVCCIPFFLYDVSLGDIVATHSVGDMKYQLAGVSERSDWVTFRLFCRDPSVWPGIASGLQQKHDVLESELFSSRLIALAVYGEDRAGTLSEDLAEFERLGLIEYETARH